LRSEGEPIINARHGQYGESCFNSEIASFFRERVVPLYGFAGLSPVPEERRHGFPRSISFGYPISKEILKQIKAGPTQEYFAEYNRLNTLLVRTAIELESLIVSLGFKALAMEGTTREYDTVALTTRIPHKTSATLSGLGWIGKCDLLVTEEFGSGIRLSTVLSDIPLTPGIPIIESRCGECRVCQQRCPAKAITGKNWVSGMKREMLYDAFSCQAMAKKLSNAIGADHSVCGICIANCPKTLKYVNG
jgi:epoxyqueuosine reductase QueG